MLTSHRSSCRQLQPPPHSARPSPDQHRHVARVHESAREKTKTPRPKNTPAVGFLLAPHHRHPVSSPASSTNSRLVGTEGTTRGGGERKRCIFMRRRVKRRRSGHKWWTTVSSPCGRQVAAAAAAVVVVLRWKKPTGFTLPLCLPSFLVFLLHLYEILTPRCPLCPP